MNEPNSNPAAIAAMAATTADPPRWDQTSNHMIAPQDTPNHAALKTKLNRSLQNEVVAGTLRRARASDKVVVHSCSATCR
jgi:hypothetical protein